MPMPSLSMAFPDACGILICGHGSRAKIASEEFSLLAKGIQAQLPNVPVAYGFLEYSAPNLHMAMDSLIAQGVTTILALPGMLFSATHAQQDIPSVLTTYQQAHPEIEIRYGQELGLLPSMIQAAEQRILDATGNSEGDHYDTLLAFVGRGTSVTEANAEAAKLGRILCENLGFGWVETCYSGITFPSVARGLEMAVKLGFKKIVVMPYFLFGGRLIDRIYNYVDKVQAEYPDIEFIKTDYLRDQAHVIDAFIHRLTELLDETHPSSHRLSDFQRRLAAGEVHLHHHHAEFQPDQHSHSHHGHTHDHQHPPYRHIGHPHGPRTMIGDNVCCCFMRQFPEWVIKEEEQRPQTKVDKVPACQA